MIALQNTNLGPRGPRPQNTYTVFTQSRSDQYFMAYSSRIFCQDEARNPVENFKKYLQHWLEEIPEIGNDILNGYRALIIIMCM